MLSPDRVNQIRSYVHEYLVKTASSSTQDWVRRFPRAAEHRWHHTLNVLKNAEAILAGEHADPDAAEVVRVAVYLHDVSMFVCDHEIHGTVSAQIAEDYLVTMALPAAFIAKVKRAIGEHGTDLGPLPPEEQGALFSWEGKVVLEADILDKLGASAIAAGLLAAGQQGALPHEALRALADGPVMERAQLFKDYIWTATGRALADQRFGFFLAFLDELKSDTHDPEPEASA
ncbi:MAG: HD domain-containing protein [Desulfobacterales bacterium]|nr:HD domain-containing protein [Desulfobacterales bacterium]